MRYSFNGCADQGGGSGDGSGSACPNCFAGRLPYMGDAGDTASVADETTQATDPGVNFDRLIQVILQEDGVLPGAMIPLAIAQCRLESNNYTSNVFKTCNNLNGYKTPQQGPTAWQIAPCIQSPEGDYYGKYSSVEDSAHELSGWWQRRRDQNGIDLTTITSYNDYAKMAWTFQWFTSSPTLYAVRLQAVGALVSIQADTGVNTQGYSNTTLAIAGGIAALALIGLL